MLTRFSYVIFFVCITQLYLIVQGDEFVVLWAPKTIIKGHSYSAIVVPTDLQGNTEVALQFKNYNLTKKLESGGAVRIEYPYQNKIRYYKENNLIMTLHVTEPIDKNKFVRICSTRTAKVKFDSATYHTFIQTDKPIYKPGDEVKFRVLVVDKDLRPYQMNNIDVYIVDPLDRSIAHFDDLEDQNFGVFEDKFILNSQTILGNWTIQVVIERSKKIQTTKKFAVQKYTFPLFDVFVSIPDPHVLLSSQVIISFYAKYPFGEFVTGNAELKLLSVNGKIFLNNSFVGVNGVQKLSYKVSSDLSISKGEIEVQALLKFTEPESGLSYSKTAKFYVHTDKRNKIIVKHPEKFKPGQSFSVNVIINNWKDQRISSHSKKVNFTSELKIGELWNKTENYLDIVDGIASYDILVPKEAVGLKIKIEFLDCKSYEKELEIGTVSDGTYHLEVHHSPRFPKLNQFVNISIKSDKNLNNVLAVAMTRYGPIKSSKIKCMNQTTCLFSVKILEKMMPQFTVMVYHLKDYVNIFIGKTEIETEDLGANYINLKLSSDNPKPKEQLKMTFSTKPKSNIHLLAFDTRLKSLGEENNINRTNIVEALESYDKSHHMLIDDMTTWHECTEEELKRVDSGRKRMKELEKENIETASIFTGKTKKVQSGYDEDYGDEEESFDIMVGFNSDFGSSEEISEEELDEPEPVDEEFRKNFPDTWIFETIEVGDNTEEAAKTFTVPDSLTSWDISAFSINENDGLAIIKPKELVVKSEFFIKINLPYSIRYKEVLKLDILVYNYVEAYEQLQVTIDIKKDLNFQIVQYTSNCTSIIDQSNIRTTTVSPWEVQKVSFYIRASSADSNEFKIEMAKVKLLITAKATSESGVSYQDKLLEELRVEPIGFRLYDVSTNKFFIDESSSSPRIFEYSGASEYSQYNAIVSGSYLSNPKILESLIETFHINYDDRALKMKESYEVYRYFRSKKLKITSSLVNNYYQSIIPFLKNQNVKISIPFRIVYVDTLGSLMKIGIIEPDKVQIIDQLNKIKSEFIDSIESDSGSWFEEKITSKIFKVAFALIPFIKHRDLLSGSSEDFFSREGTSSSKNYDSTIVTGMNFLKNNEGTLKSDIVGLSIAAYVYALYGKAMEAQKLLDELEEFKVIKKSQKCYKLTSSDASCNNLVTAYAALAYVKLSKTKETLPIFNWLIESNPFLKFTVEYAILTEAIAEIGITNITISTNLKVKLQNKLKFQTEIEIKNELSASKVVEFPEYTRNITTTVSGSGFCSVSIVSERMLSVPVRNPKFSIEISTNDAENLNGEGSVTVCAVYNPTESDFTSLNDVFYEIELPSGYIYKGYSRDKYSDKNIMEVQERRKGTIVSVYFNEFQQNQKYCVEIKATKMFTVKESSKAAVRVYDYSEKTNSNIEFFNFSHLNC